MTKEFIAILQDMAKEYELLAKYNGGRDYLRWNALRACIEEQENNEAKTCTTCQNNNSHHGVCDICHEFSCWTPIGGWKKNLNVLPRVYPKNNNKGNCTNGDMIKAMFPDVDISELNRFINFSLDHSKCSSVKSDWWNAPYKREVEADGENNN